ncbi:MAG: glycosyltransferase [Gemmatimonadota bacterium]|nr:glycosyltransferase [Gemmatimonadota bacterium]
MPEALRVGVFSEVGRPGSGSRHFSGVSNFLSYNIRYCKRRSLEMDLHSYADDDRIDEDGSVQLFGWRPRVPVRVDPTIPQDLRHVVPDQRILRAAAARCYDVINVIAPGTMGMQGIWVARRLGIPVVAMYTTSIAEYAGKRAAEVLGSLEAVKVPTVSATEAIGWWVMRRFYSKRNGIEAVLAPTRRTLEAIGPRLDAPLSILGRGVDTELFRPAHNESSAAGDAADRDAGVPGAGPTILYSGRLHRGDKDLDRFIEILDAVPEARLLVVGDGPHREGLEADLGDRAEFTGKLAGEELAAAYRRCDFFVFPSKHDTFGQVVMEAMASGLPVVVTNRGGPQELVDDGATGFVADDDRFVDRVRELAECPELRREMGRKARLAAEARSWTRVFDELMGHYRRLAAGREGKE